MRPSSNWRKKSDDGTVDIFGNKKRGGGGDPIRTTGGSIIPNISTINNNKYKLLPQNVNPPSAITVITPTSLPTTSIPPHLRSSMDLFYAETNTKKLSDELFRQQLDQQIAAQKQQKYFQRLQEIEQEKLSEKKIENEFQELRSKYIKEINNESSVNAGFLRYKNSHSHIPPANNINNNRIFEEIKETETETENENEIEFKKCIQTTNVIPDNLKSLEMQLLQEKLAWKHKISEQELELKKLKLQMLEQQNDQKTTLQYLLKLQTDFTEQIYNNNKNNNINIRRPLSGLRRSIDLSPTPPTPRTLLSQIQSNNNLLQQMQQSLSYKQQPIQYTQHTQHHPQHVHTQQHTQHHAQHQQPSSYFPMQQISPPLTQQTQSPIQYIEEPTPPESQQEEKQESFLCPDNMHDNMHDNEYGVLLNNESSFLVFSESDTETEVNMNNNNQLNSSTKFELSSRPTTAIPLKKKKSLSPTGSYSSFGGNNGNNENKKNNDPFTIHVVVDDDDDDDVVVENDDNNKWKQISDIDRNNVESLRDALEEISNEEFAIYNDDNIIPETIDDKIPVKTPNTSMTQEMFVVKYIESKQNEDIDIDIDEDDVENENETDYEQDFEIESEIQQNEKQEKDVLRLPELDASINNFESKVYSVYSSFDESLITNSVASSSDYSNKALQTLTCKTITE